VTIKQTPEGFCVEEILTEAARQRIVDRPGPLAVYSLVKMRLTTPDAASAIAKALGVPAGSVSYAGLKDKHAHTLQYVSVAVADPSAAPPELDGPNWRIKRLGWTDQPLDASAIEGNRFGITVTGLTRREVDTMDRSAAVLAPAVRPDVVRFVNYFGDQRFGSARHGKGFLARWLIRGEFEQALRLAIATPARKDQRRQKDFRRLVADGWGKWKDLLKRLPGCPERAAVEVLAKEPTDFRGAFAALPYLSQWLGVEAYQSHLWNRIARRFVEACRGDPGEAIVAKDPFGPMVFPPAAAIGPDLADLNLPLLGRNSALVEPWKAAAQAVLKEEGITTADLRIPGLRRPYFGEAPRRLFADATNFAASPPRADDGGKGRLQRVLTFDLPRGAYATVLLRALGQ
jgi:tRNA pseudouridine13 synthase